MRVNVNGRSVELNAGARVGDAVTALRPGRNERGIAVAVNGEVVPRSEWLHVELAPGDDVEILTAVAGG